MKMETEIKGKIYKLICNQCEKFYIGSTISTLPRRFFYHKKDVKKRNSVVYQHIREHGIENVKMVLIEDVICSSKDALRSIEDKFIRELKPELNMYNAVLNIEKCKERRIQYEKTEKCKEIKKKYRQTEKCKEIQKKYEKTEKRKDYKKKYENTEKCKEQRKIYRQKVKQFRELMNELPIGLI